MRCSPGAAGRVLAAAAMLVAVAAAGLLSVLGAAPASAATPCVGVLVDARLLGGSLRTGCALGDPANGLAALTRAGFRYTPRPRDGLICQVDAQPASCATTTTTRYWSYWYRNPGSRTWVYANQGAGTHNPKPGATEAWVWQDGGRRPPPDIALTTICPQAASPAPTATRTRTATPTPSRTRTAKPSASASRPPSTSASARKSSAAPSPTRSPTPSPTRPTSSAPRTTSASAAATGTPSTASASALPPDPGPTTSPAPAAADSGGGPSLPAAAGVAVGGALAAGLGVAAVARSRRTGS